jgi:hypothetical protein
MTITFHYHPMNYNLICIKATTLSDFIGIIDYINSKIVSFYSALCENYPIILKDEN